MEHLAKAASTSIDYSLSIEALQRQLGLASQALRLVNLQGRAHRDRDLEARTDALANEGKLPASQVYDNLLQRERQCEAAWAVRAVNQTSSRRGVTSVTAPGATPGERIELFDKVSIEQACLRENQRHFQQARYTPPYTSPLYEALGDLGLGSTSQAILNGTFAPPPDTDQYAVLYLAALFRPSSTAILPNDITLEEYIAGWWRSDERTSCGCSGLNFSHFIADLRHDHLLHLDWTMLRLSLKFGLVPTRWKQGINVMLEKQRGNNNVEKMRTILLFEPDFNFLNKFVGRQMMAAAEQQGLLAPEQYGSRKYLSAPTQAWNKKGTYNIL